VVSVLQLACCAPAPEPKVQQAHRLEQLQSQTSECLQNMTGEAVLTCTSSSTSSSTSSTGASSSGTNTAPASTKRLDVLLVPPVPHTLTVLLLPGELVLSSCWVSSRPSHDTCALPCVLPLPLLER